MPPATGRPTDAQLSCQSRLLSAFRQARQVFDVSLPSDLEGATHKLLGSRFDYGGQVSSVEPYKAELVSLPCLRGRAVSLEGIFVPDAKELLTSFPSHTLEEQALVDQTLREQHIRSYMDEVLRFDS